MGVELGLSPGNAGALGAWGASSAELLTPGLGSGHDLVVSGWSPAWAPCSAGNLLGILLLPHPSSLPKIKK